MNLLKRFPAWLTAVVLALLTIALYWPVREHAFVDYDDPIYVTANPRVLAGLTWQNCGWAFATSDAANWHPLTWLSLMLDVTLFGKPGAAMHFTNVVFHAANVVLLFWLLLYLTGAKGRSAGVAALFAAHPAHVESVAWVAERKDVLSAFFGFIALIFYVRYARKSEVGNQGSKVRADFYFAPSYWLAWIFLALV